MGNFAKACIGWMSSSISSSASISSTRACRSSSSSSVSKVTTFPFYSMESLPNYKFHGDIRIVTATYLSSLGLGIRGDFRISGGSPTYTLGFYTASLAVLSTKPTLLLVVVILFKVFVVVRELGGSNTTWCSTLYALHNSSNLK